MEQPAEATHHHHHQHHHQHQHGHHHHVQLPTSSRGVVALSIALNLLFVFIEALVGFWENSLSLLSDAGHNLGDVFSLMLVLVACHLAQKRHTRRFTYGYKKATVLISLLNALILLAAVGCIAIEAVHKWQHPALVDGAVVSWTAGVGIAINGVTTWLLMRNRKDDLNMRGAFLHMAADTLVSAGVVGSGLAMMWTGLAWIDPLVSLVIAAVILLSTWGLLTESLRLALDGTPQSVNVRHIEEMMARQPHVMEVHHVHVWAISTTENALTAHVVIDDIQAMTETKRQLKKLLAGQGVQHSTLEMEEAGQPCGDTDGCC